MSGWKSSSYNIFVPLKDGKSLAYNSCSNALAIWDSDDEVAYRSITDNETRYVPVLESAVNALATGGFIVAEDFDELNSLEEDYLAQRFDQGTMTLTIAPTMACNFGCDYCFQGQDKPGESMSVEVQDAIIDFVDQAAPTLQNLGVAWYGGEPLVKMKTIESLSDRLMDLCSERGIAYSAMMVTNGYKLNQKVAESLLSRQVSTVQVTLDGPQHYHDQRRALLSGKGTFDRISENLIEVVENTRLSISVRINIDSRNSPSIHSLLEHMAEIGLANRKNLNVYFAPVESITEGCHIVSDVCMTKSDYGALEVALTRKAYELGLSPLPYPPRFRGTCAAVRPRGFVIIPSGEVHKCWDTVNVPERSVGTIFNMLDLEKNERNEKWLTWTPFKNTSCRNCKILPNCAGACAYKFVHSGSTRGEAAVLPCPSWKYNINERLVLRAEKMGILKAGVDFSDDDIATNPQDICTDVRVEGGDDLPDAMQQFSTSFAFDNASVTRAFPVRVTVEV